MSRKKPKKTKQAAIVPIVTEIFLRTPQEYGPVALAKILEPMLATGHVPALLINAPCSKAASLAETAKILVPLAQKYECAALIENDCSAALECGADGVHITQGPDAHEAALAQMKPDFIVGGQSTSNRHDAMLMAERGADYILFSNTDQSQNSGNDPEETGLDLAVWWAKTFETPTVFSGQLEDALAMSAEFFCVRELLWTTDSDPVAALEKIFTALHAKAN